MLREFYKIEMVYWNFCDIKKGKYVNEEKVFEINRKFLIKVVREIKRENF